MWGIKNERKHRRERRRQTRTNQENERGAPNTRGEKERELKQGARKAPKNIVVGMLGAQVRVAQGTSFGCAAWQAGEGRKTDVAAG